MSLSPPQSHAKALPDLLTAVRAGENGRTESDPVNGVDRRSWEEKLPIHPARLAPTSEFDCDLQRRVRSFLASRHYQALRCLRIDVTDGAVVLSGTVPTFHQRQVAFECAKHVAGVLRVIDRLNVSDLSTEHQARE